VLANLGSTAGTTTDKIKSFADKIDTLHKDLPEEQRKWLKDAAAETIKEIDKPAPKTR
jgi:hypothetical protein